MKLSLNRYIIIYGFVLLYFVDFRIGLIIIGASIFSAVFAPHVGAKTVSKRLKNFLDTRGIYTSKVKDFLEGFKLIRKDTYSNILNKHEEILKTVADKRYFYGMAKSFFDVIRGLFLYFLNIVAYVSVGWFMLFKNITIGTGAAALGYISSFTDPILSIIADMTAIRSVKGIKSKITKMLEDLPQDSKPLIPITFNQTIRFENYTVKYDDFSLFDFDYTFEKGKKYAIIGGNGSGKSTVLNSLMKYIEPNLITGNIYIDNHNLNNVDISIIWAMNQLEHVFNVDFISNVTLFGCFEFNYENIKNRLGEKVSDKLLKIKEMQDASNLSGGEKQLLAFVRTVLADKDIWLLDEPFSAVDAKIVEDLKSFITSIKNKTIIYVTHDISDHLNYFDEILVMNNGKLLGYGKWKEVQNIYKQVKEAEHGRS